MKNSDDTLILGAIVATLMLAFIIVRIMFNRAMPTVEGFKLPDWVFFFMRGYSYGLFR